MGDGRDFIFALSFTHTEMDGTAGCAPVSPAHSSEIFARKPGLHKPSS